MQEELANLDDSSKLLMNELSDFIDAYYPDPNEEEAGADSVGERKVYLRSACVGARERILTLYNQQPEAKGREGRTRQERERAHHLAEGDAAEADEQSDHHDSPAGVCQHAGRELLASIRRASGARRDRREASQRQPPAQTRAVSRVIAVLPPSSLCTFLYSLPLCRDSDLLDLLSLAYALYTSSVPPADQYNRL